MEESIELYARIKERYSLKATDIKTYSPLTLAFIGDGVYELVIRSYLVGKGNRDVNGLHKDKSRYVKAQTQAVMAEVILDLLTEEEQDIYRRGRNAKSYTTAKNASVGDYRKATGFEALCGFLYMTGQTERMLELIETGVKELKNNDTLNKATNKKIEETSEAE